MLRKLRIALSVMVTLTLIGGALSFLFMPKNNQAEFGMIEPAANGAVGERENSLDVLFVGDSEVYSAYSPLQMWKEHGFTSYDVSCAGQSTTYSFTLLKRALTKQTPRVVVFETNALFRFFSLGEGISRIAQDAIPLLEYHNRWKSLTQADFSSVPQATWSDDFKGFKINAKVKPADTSNYGAATNDVTAVPRNNSLWLRMMVSYCRKRNIIPILMSTPSTVNWDMAKHNGAQALADELGIAYVDLNLIHDQLGIDWSSDTYDGGDHLNSAGAGKVTQYVGEYLSKTYKLVDHRSDSAYNAWDASFERYAKRLKSA